MREKVLYVLLEHNIFSSQNELRVLVTPSEPANIFAGICCVVLLPYWLHAPARSDPIPNCA